MKFEAEVTSASFKVVRSEDVVVRVILDTADADLNQLKVWRQNKTPLRITIEPSE
jgi:hypothetical protein